MVDLNPTPPSILSLAAKVSRGWPFISKNRILDRATAAIIAAIAAATVSLRRERDTLLIASHFQMDTLNTLSRIVDLPFDHLDATELIRRVVALKTDSVKLRDEIDRMIADLQATMALPPMRPDDPLIQSLHDLRNVVRGVLSQIEDARDSLFPARGVEHGGRASNQEAR